MLEPEVENLHTPVLLMEAMHFLSPNEGGLFVDATLGLGGHSEEILRASGSTELIAIDQDAAAIAKTQKRLEPFEGRTHFVHANFAKVKSIVKGITSEMPKGILADLGVSSLQFDSDTRGFSFRFDAPLDMRMDPDSGGQTVAELLAEADEPDIANIIYRYGEERASRRIARWIVEKREQGEPITTTRQLADLVKRAVRTNPKERTHPATRTFQALRIAVNKELDILEGFISDSVDLLDTGGTLAMITFHSLEDRIVKHAFQRLAGKCFCPPRMPVCRCGAVKKVEIVTRKPILPSEAELQVNQRSQSAKLRACRKLEV